ncbi:phosphatidate cytidylyltransferase [Comamonas sp. NLF-1-9]|uniref:phosphatidate cytidylyltransferase n=1 Tax=Comamonas sp. NLF-1-9 TaxID=2853163 RepID=UPI001C449465|nr:phosphatidate cytidylyltransferase [Comamonas sp. NLF-1-9]QXL84806.1 phosphatidate cytidylyltransferase [Comamonas sp. NLF-1-9]
MLKQRILTALVLLAVLLPALFYPSFVPLAVLTLVLIAAGCWEWGRLNGLAQGPALSLGALGALLCAASWQAGWILAAPPWLWTLAGAAWVVLGGWLLARGVGRWQQVARGLRLLGGLLALWLAWLAMARARALGINFLLSLLCLVWAADIFAYFAGRTFGRRKLAPAISPGKSWEGVFGGMAGVLVLALLWAWADAHWQAASPSFYSLLAARGLLWWLPALLFLAVMSVVGDLVESLVKRSVGAKDSSALLPGHGGVLDRIDALLPTLPLALMITEFAQA